MIKILDFFKKLYYKKKLAGITICFLTAIFLMPISSISALGEIINPYFERPLNNNIFTTFKSNYIYNEYYNDLKDYYENTYKIGYPYYLIFGASSDTANRKPIMLIFNNSNDLEKLEFYISANYGTNVGFNFILNSTANGMKCEFRVISGNEQIRCDDNIYSLETNFGYCSTKNGCQEGIDSLENLFDTNISVPLALGIRRNSPSSTNYRTFNYKDILYNTNDVIVSDLSKIGNDIGDEDYIPQRKLYNFQIDLKNQDHLQYNHSFQIDYNAYNRPFENLLKGFEFIGLTNNNGLYNWEKTDSCYINNNDYQLTSSDEHFKIDISSINGDCLNYYDRVKLIVKLNNASLQFNNNLLIDTNSIIHYNFLSDSSVADILSNYRYVNFTTNKNDVNFDLMVRHIQGSNFYNRHFFKYFDKNNLKSTEEYANVFIGPYPLYNQMYHTRGITLDKNKGLTVFTHEPVNNELFIFEYKDVYYSFTDNEFNKDVVIIDDTGTRQDVDIDIEYPEPPIENIGDIDVGVGSLKEGISAIHTLYSTFYNNLSIEFQILHNLFFTLTFILIVVRVVLK